MSKEQEKFVQIIQNERRKEHNKECAECGERGPQYICSTFNTFVCNLCSGIHREFCHRIKSISMSQFSYEEVKDIISGGNLVARNIYLARYKKNDFRCPNPGEIDRIRDWIRIKYVEKRWFRKSKKEKKRVKNKTNSQHLYNDQNSLSSERNEKISHTKLNQRKNKSKFYKNVKENTDLVNKVQKSNKNSKHRNEKSSSIENSKTNSKTADLLDLDDFFTEKSEKNEVKSDEDFESWADFRSAFPSQQKTTHTKKQDFDDDLLLNIPSQIQTQNSTHVQTNNDHIFNISNCVSTNVDHKKEKRNFATTEKEHKDPFASLLPEIFDTKKPSLTSNFYNNNNHMNTNKHNSSDSSSFRYNKNCNSLTYSSNMQPNNKPCYLRPNSLNNEVNLPKLDQNSQRFNDFTSPDITFLNNITQKQTNFTVKEKLDNKNDENKRENLNIAFENLTVSSVKTNKNESLNFEDFLFD